MLADRGRALEIDGPSLDARTIILGAAAQDDSCRMPTPQPVTPLVAWEGAVQGDGTGPQASYFVRLYADGTATCQCPAFYFRGTLRRDQAFACKHVRRARLRVEQA